MLCKGNCGIEAKFGNWCCESYHRCPGYRKKLSNRAKMRGNNGIKGPLSKIHYIENCNVFEIFNFICSECKVQFQKRLLRGTALRKDFIPVCKKCHHKKQGISLKETYFQKAKSLPYTRLTRQMRKRICWENQGHKCNHCGFNNFDLDNGPYELHHKDGNKQNDSIENEEVICRNCHYMTKNWGFKGRKPSDKCINIICDVSGIANKKRKSLYF